MKKVIALLFCLPPFSANATTPPPSGLIIFNCVEQDNSLTNVCDTSTTNNYFDGNTTATLMQQVWVAGYYGQGTLGGGLFQYSGESTGAQHVCPSGLKDDKGVVIVAGGTRCYQRVFSGAVHLSWYGVTSSPPGASLNFVANSSACLAARQSCDSSALVSAAFAASSAFGNGQVTSDGVPFVWWPTPGNSLHLQNLEIPSSQHLDCGMPPGSLQKQGGTSGAPGAYYSQPNSIVLGEDPGHPWLTSVQVDARAEISNCNILPSWFTPTPPTTSTFCTHTAYQDIDDAICASQLFVGTGLLMSDEGALAHNLFIVGFDVCAESKNSPRSHLYDSRMDCNTGVWSHAQKGGSQVNGIISKEFFFGNFSSTTTNKPLTPYLTTVSAINAGGYGQMTLTYDHTNDHIHNGDILIVQGFGTHNNVQFVGDVDPSTTCFSYSSTICNIKPDNTFDNPLVGEEIYDSPSGCLPKTTPPRTVTSFGLSDDGKSNLITTTGTVAHPQCLKDSITVQINNTSPAAANGRWLASCGATLGALCGGTVDLLGSSYNGPAPANVGWENSRQFMTVIDTANIAVGQFACLTSGISSVPFCTPPPGWAFSTTVATNLANINSGNAPWSITVGSTANWPSFGYVYNTTNCTTEIMSYTVVSLTSISITTRGADGSAKCSGHQNSDTLMAAAPQVVGVSAKNNTVVLNATASAPPSPPVALTFANDHHADTTGLSPNKGGIGVNPSYKTWTANQNIGSTPDAILTAIPTAYTTGTAVTVTVPNAWKVQPGMTVTNLDSSAFPLPTATVTAVDTTTSPNSPASGVVKLTGSVGFTSGNRLQFTGCGYPAGQPWLGNCAATAYFFGDASASAGALGPNADSANAQGGLVFSINDHGHRRGLGGANWSDAHLSEIVLANGSGTGAQLDPTSYGATFEDSALIDINDMSMQGTSNSFYTNASTGGLTAGIGLVNPILATSPLGNMTIQTGPGPTTTLSIVEGKGNSSGVAFFSPKQLGVVLEANNLPGIQPVYGLDSIAGVDAATTTTGCGNSFATGPQCQLGTPQFAAGTPLSASVNSSGWSLNGGASGTGNVTLAPNKSSTNTGLGGTAGNVSVIIAGNEDVRHDSSHHTTFQGSPPTVPGASQVTGNDMVGRIYLGSPPPANIAITFHSPWGIVPQPKPVCTATDETNLLANPLQITSISLTGVTFTPAQAMAASDQISYMCLGFRL